MSVWLYVLGVPLVAFIVGFVVFVPIVRADETPRTRVETIERSGNVRVLGRDEWGFGEWVS